MIPDESNTFVLAESGPAPDLRIVFEREMQPGFLSIVIPVYRDAKGLADTLGSLLPAGVLRDRFEIIVVNDGGSAEVAAVGEEYGIHPISQVPNRGSYAARNRGIAASAGEFIALLDADVVVAETWWGAVFAAASERDLTAGRVRMKMGAVPSLTEYYQAVSFFPETRLRQVHKFITTANVVLRRRVIEKLGGFDARLRSGGDYEFSRRVADAGFSLGFSPELGVSHPCRDYGQLLASIERTLYGQTNLGKLYGDKFRNSPMEPPSIAKLLLPRRSLFQNPVPGLTFWLRTKLFFFAWWIKLQMIPMILRIRRRQRERTV